MYAIPFGYFHKVFSMRRALVSICVLQAFSASSWAEEATIDTASL
jgi:iron complex outermembrane receptor protein